MEVRQVNDFIPLAWQQKEPQKTTAVQGEGFGEVLKRALNEVNELQLKSQQAAVSLALGEVKDVHQALITMEQARLALELTVQVRNKLIDAYQEISRMQI
ncbi:MAG: flagellar hook-basal body complex protein FliE [Firmicutes bacterium]|nr:flagellar hook-basal body complex protein FliE [Bacillota bacterium]